MIRIRVLRFKDLPISTNCCSATDRVEVRVSSENVDAQGVAESPESVP